MPTFGLVQFKRLRDDIACMDGDNISADIWCAVDEFIDEFNRAETIDDVLNVNGTADFFARLYCICAYIWNYDNCGNAPADSKSYALRALDSAITDLTV